MVNILEFLQDVADVKQSHFVRKDAREAARKAFERGLQCIIKCQVVVGDEPTAWCSRYDDRTLQPRSERWPEPVALNARESADILLLLMNQEAVNPSEARAIHTGCAWFETAQLAGLRLEKKDGDVAVVVDLDASPIWARLYDIGKNRPIFTMRNGTAKSRLAEIEPERRTELAWYGTWGETVLRRYAAWKGQ
jgi:PelA/Pel-15E family pectate lyase